MASYTRFTINEGLDFTIISDLTGFLHEYNPFRTQYLTARERLKANPGQLRMVLNPQMRLMMEIRADRRRENLPTVDEVAAIIPYEAEVASHRDIVFAERTEDGTLRAFSKIHAHHAAYMPLAYPLMFPFGDHGYHWGLKLGDTHQQGRKLDRMGWRAYWAYMLHPRRLQHVVPFAYKRLFQAILTDAWAAGDQQKLSWLLHHQKELRSDLYSGVQDWLRNADGDQVELGQRVILPATYVGGQRFIAACYQDSMAIVRALGPPTLFITVTANPNWPEITCELGPGQTAADRPDIVGRVFKLKTQALVRELKAGIFGPFAGIV